MIELNNVSFSYGDKEILKDISITVKNGECLCLTGKSGCGKTTVLRLIAGLEKEKSGFIKADGKISYVFQEDRLVPTMSVLKNITLCLPKHSKESAMKLLKEAGLEACANLLPQELSGGMKRRAAIVRAVAYGGDVLLLDEPFNGLDGETKRIMAKMIKREFSEKPILMVSHIEEDAEIMEARQIELTRNSPVHSTIQI